MENKEKKDYFKKALCILCIPLKLRMPIISAIIAILVIITIFILTTPIEYKKGKNLSVKSGASFLLASLGLTKSTSRPLVPPESDEIILKVKKIIEDLKGKTIGFGFVQDKSNLYQIVAKVPKIRLEYLRNHLEPMKHVKWIDVMEQNKDPMQIRVLLDLYNKKSLKK